MDYWAQSTPGIRYVRVELPARATGGRVLEFGDAWYSEAPESRPGPSVWQLVANRVRLHAMVQQQEHGMVYLEVDDDYTRFHRQYVRGAWVERDSDADSYVSSVECHRAAAELADGVIVSTPYLADLYGELNDNVYICRNGADPADWPELPEREADEPFRVIFAGSPNPNDLMLVRRAMTWAAAQPGVEAHMICDYDPKWPGVRVHGWIDSLDRYRQVLVGLKPDLGLRPIELTPFSRGKSDLKVLEYAMAGALACVTPSDPYKDWSGTEVLTAFDAKAWEQQVKWAVKNRDEVRERARAVRELILQTRSLDAIKEDWGAVEDVARAVM